MTWSLTRRQRSLLLFLSASGYIAWFSGLGDRLAAQDIATSPIPATTLDRRTSPPRVASLITRDPFNGVPPEAGVAAPAARDDAAVETTRNASRTPLETNDVLGRDASAISVPNIADSHISATQLPDRSTTLTIRATIVGSNPVAYVEDGTAMDIVRIGDLLGERRIVKIDLRGLAFEDGSRLDLPGSFMATPAPARSRSAVTIGLDDLRRLLLRPSLAQRPAATETVVPKPTPSSQVPAFPTPGPLPTVDMRGLPVGVNPTSNPNAPTPYPNPYPYAPPSVPH